MSSESQKMVLDSQELELQAVVSQLMWVLGTEVSLTTESSL